MNTHRTAVAITVLLLVQLFYQCNGQHSEYHHRRGHGGGNVGQGVLSSLGAGLGTGVGIALGAMAVGALARGLRNNAPSGGSVGYPVNVGYVAPMDYQQYQGYPGYSSGPYSGSGLGIGGQYPVQYPSYPRTV